MQYISIVFQYISKYKAIGLIVLGLLLFVSYTLSFLYGGINQDMTYYMNTVKLMTEGYVPYRDFDQGYTPLAYYLMYFPVLIFGNQIYTALTCVYLVLLADVLLVYSICKKIGCSTDLSVLGSLLFLLLSRVFESDCFYLEPFVLLPGLSAILLMLLQKKWCIVFSGFLCFAAFWTKQYGIGFIGLTSVYMVADAYFCTKKYSRLLLLWIGFCIGALFFVGSMLIQGVKLGQMFQLSGSAYSREGWFGLWCGMKAMIKCGFPILLFPILHFNAFRKSLMNPYFLLCLFGTGGFLLQTYVRPYGHYLILMAPFCSFALIYVYKRIRGKNLFFFQSMYLVLIALLITSLAKGNIRTYNENRKLRQYCIEVSNNIAQIVPRGSHNVYANSDIDRLLAYFLETTPPVHDRECAGLNFEADINAINRSIISSDFVISHGCEFQKEYKKALSNFEKSFLLNKSDHVCVYSKKRLISTED